MKGTDSCEQKRETVPDFMLEDERGGLNALSVSNEAKALFKRGSGTACSGSKGPCQFRK